jgi:tetratricopeptide (TPR) repeat protein
MSDLLVGALSLLLATNRPAELETLLQARTGITWPQLRGASIDTNDPVAVELAAIEEAEDAAQAAVRRWLAPHAGAQSLPAEVQERIDERQSSVRRRYVDFVTRHPGRADGHVSYGGYLEDLGEEPEMVVELERARELDPRNPIVWHQLAAHYAHRGPIEKAFPYFDEAVRLNPTEPVFWNSLGTVTFLFRRDAEAYFKTNEAGVFARAFGYYDRAMQLRPFDFQLASEVAKSWYGVRPQADQPAQDKAAAEARIIESGLAAWTNALRVAPNDEEREQVRVHFARWNIRARRFDIARSQLDTITNIANADVRRRLEQTLTNRMAGLP